MTKRIPSMRNLLESGLILLAMLLFLAFPARYGESIRTGISLWAVSVLPATLPMLVLTALFTGTYLFGRLSRAVSPLSRRIFHISGAGACAGLVSALSGYPVGARTASDLVRTRQIGQDELLAVSGIATTSGPAFLVGVVGCGMFRDAVAGWLLLVSHLLGIYLVSWLLNFRSKRTGNRTSPPVGKRTFADILSGSVLSVLCVGGAIALFYAFGQMISDLAELLSLPGVAVTAVRGLLEMTSGCALLSETPSALSLAGSCFFVTFGGLCVLVQQLAFLAPVGVPARKFVPVKLLQGIVAGAICFGLALLFGYQ